MLAAWITDPHFNFVDKKGMEAFIKYVASKRPDVLWIGGDIAESSNFYKKLKTLAKNLKVPIYFVLGNHDYYGSSIKHVRERISKWMKKSSSEESKLLHWLPECGVVPLPDNSCLVGHGGFYDGKLGDYARSAVRLADQEVISEFMGIPRMLQATIMEKLANDAAQYMANILEEATSYQRIFILTHVPPFEKSSVYNGRISGKGWLPYFCSPTMGDVILDFAERHPEIAIEVLCGHTHGAGQALITPNVFATTGGARYGHPSINLLIKIEDKDDQNQENDSQ